MIDTLLHMLSISEDDLPYYRYGLIILLETVSVQLLFILWAIFRHQLTDYLIFFVVFQSLRRYGGGFHFRNFLPCFITSALSIMGILELQQHISLGIISSVLICSLSLLFIILEAPVPSVTEHPAQEELCLRKHKLTYIVCILEILVILLALLKQNHILNLFIITFIFMAIIMIAGKLRLYYYRSKSFKHIRKNS